MNRQTILIRAAREVLLPLLALILAAALQTACFLVSPELLPAPETDSSARKSASLLVTTLSCTVVAALQTAGAAHPRPTQLCSWGLRLGAQAGLAAISKQNDLAVAIDKDPHFRPLLANDHVRVFALTLAPDSESFVRYAHNFITIAPEDNEVVMWREGQSAVQHYRVPRGEIHFFLEGSHGFRNDARSGDYHNVTVEFLDPGVTTYGYRYYQGKWDYGPSILNPPVDAAGHFVNSLDLGRAVASDVQLLPREFLPASKRQQLLVAVSALDLQMGKRKLRLEPGEVLWLEGREAELVNASNNAARFAVVELKAASEQY